MTSIGELR